MSVTTTDSLRQMAVDGVSDALDRALVRWELKPDQQAVMRAFRSALLSNDSAVQPFLNLWLGFVPGSYTRGALMAQFTVPQNLVDEFNKLKSDAAKDGKELLLEVEDLVKHGEEAAKAEVTRLIDLFKAKLSK